MDPQHAINFCKQHGTELEKHRVAFLFEGERDDKKAVELFEADELVRGGFPYNLKLGNPACLSDTVVRLGIMIELDLFDEPITARTCDFLLSVQLPDGGWDEDHRLLDLNPPRWDRPGDLMTRTWLSGEILRQLAKVVIPRRPRMRRGCRFLLKHFDGVKIAGFTIATAIALGAFSVNNRMEKAHALLLAVREFAYKETDPAFLNWYLDCFADYGLPLGDLSAVACLDKLERLQRSDGAWGTGDGETWAVNTTINALKHLKRASRW